MKRYLLMSPILAAALLAAPAFAQTKAKANNVPEIAYESVPNYLKLPAGLYLGEAMGVATNSKGHVFVFTRSANTRLFEFDQNGVFVRRSARATTASSSHTRCASIRRTTSGPWTKAPTWSSSSIRRERS